MILRTIVSMVAGAAIFGAGYASHGLSTAAPAAPQAALAQQPSPSVESREIDSGRMAAMIERAVRSALAEAQPACDARERSADETAVLDPAAREAEDDRADSQDQAQSQIRAAIERGVWTAEDAREMQVLAADLLPAQRDALGGSLATALNAQLLRSDVFPPF